MAWRVRSTETVASDQLTVSIDCGATSTWRAVPPMARVHDRRANRPGVIVDEEILDVSDVAIRRVDMMSDDGAAAAQVAPILRSDRQRS